MQRRAVNGRLGIVLRTKRSRRADACSAERLLEKPAQVLGLTEFDKTAERTVKVGCGRIYQHAGLVLIAVGIRVNTLPDAGGIVPAFEGEFPD